MKSKRAERYIREVYNLDGHGYNGGSLRAAQNNNNHPKYAIQAVEWAEEDMKQKAIETYKNTCSFSPEGCCMMKKEAGKCDCENLNDFIEELNS